MNSYLSPRKRKNEIFSGKDVCDKPFTEFCQSTEKRLRCNESSTIPAEYANKSLMEKSERGHQYWAEIEKLRRMSGKKEELENSVKELQQRVKDLQQDIEQKEQILLTTEENIRVNTLKQQLSQHGNECQDVLEQRSIHHQKETVHCKHQMEEQRKTLEEAIARESSLQQQLSLLPSMGHSQMEQTTSHLLKELLEIKHQDEVLKKAEEDALKMVNILQQQLSGHQSDIQCKIEQRTVHLHEEIEQWKHQVGILEETNKEAITRENTLKQHLNQLQSSVHDEIEQRTKHLLNEPLQYKNENEELRRAKEEALRRIHTLEQQLIQIQAGQNEMEQRTAHLQKEILQCNNQNDKLKKAEEEALQRVNMLNQHLSQHQSDVKNEIEQRTAHLQKEIVQCKHEVEMLKETNEEALTRENTLKQQLNQLQSSVHDEIEQRTKHLSQELLKYKSENDELRRAKEEALTRLSKVAGAKLTHGNAAITDLSDDNRPMKIAEKFSELYDNAWTDAFEEIEERFDIDEKYIIELLLSILESAYKRSTEIEKEYESSIIRAVTTIPTMAHVYREQDTYVIPTNVPLTKSLCDIRITLGASCALLMQEMFLSRLPNLLHQELNKYKPGSTVDINTIPKTVHYAKSCASLSWLMRIREPPVYIHFDFKSGKPYDENSYRYYTKSGTVMDYVVWPPLYLHEHGPLLGKGVAQPL